MKILRGIIALIVGYAVIVLLTTLGFNVWLRGADLYRSGPLILSQGIMVAVVAGLCGGYVAAVIGRKRPVVHGALVLVPLAVDTAYVLFWFPRTTPLWFEAMGSATLMACTLLGSWLYKRFRLS